MDNAIEVKNVEKYYKIYKDKGNTLKEKVLFKERRQYEKREVLQGISFSVPKGEAIGLIGENGCGKSTTLKLLTRILYPDSGKIRISGRVSSLIELGAGFHPDMSGRENIYINASIFGLGRKEIDHRIEEIVNFSELGKYIDNPVRTYSSGMYMRLAFSVAINVNADILLIDEILGVGDMYFQAKCFKKLKEIKQKGTTIVIVSHSLGQIEEICEKSIWLKDGKIVMEGKPDEVHPQYIEYMNQKVYLILEGSKMALWLDMTNSLVTWNGGVVGIIRAELEIAKNLKANHPELRISVNNDGRGFVEIPEKELEWLWNADSVADAYMEKMGRKQETNKTKNDNESVATLLQKPEGLEKAYGYSTSRLQRLKRAGYLSVQNTPKVLRPFEYAIGGVCYAPLKMASCIRMKCKHRHERIATKKAYKVAENRPNEIYYPYKENDIVLSVGWYSSNKEELFSKIKSKLKNFYLVYLVYDILLIKTGTKQFYPESDLFKNYFEWITNNCDIVLYGGKTAQTDSEKYQRDNNLRIPMGDFVKFGAEVTKNVQKQDKKILKEKFNITGKYILTVGSVEPRKNHEVLYKAYSFLKDCNKLEEFPQIIVVGGEYRCANFRDAIKVDPKVEGKIVILHPSDDELDLLYQECEFVVLPSLYEGWSLTLPEAFNYGKLCICADVPPLREVGQEFAEYVDALNPVAWANSIEKYTRMPSLVREKEKYLKENWKKTTWNDCAKQIYSKIHTMLPEAKEGILYYDLTLVFSLAFSKANVSGILRSVLILARYLGHIFPQMHYFAISTVRGYIEIDRKMIDTILGTDSVDAAFEKSKYALINAPGNIVGSSKEEDIEKSNNWREIKWLLYSLFPEKLQEKTMEGYKNQKDREKREGWLQVPFKESDMIFSAGTGYDFDIYDELVALKKKIGFRFVQLVYDFTPILLPQVHRKETVRYYIPFLKFTSEISDVVFYGGETAMRDGVEYQKKNKLAVRPGVPIRFGSNIVSKTIGHEEEKEELKKLGIKGPFIMAVGSLELRKNYETLYHAYLRMLEQEEGELPQLVFAGYPGWKTEELLQTICRDERIWDKLLIRTPTDTQMEILYRNCMFTVLASHYEGWSLTLPESLNHGKFCIASDVDPLKEIGRDFIDYVHPWDVAGWAEKMLYYYKNTDELLAREKRLSEEWHAITWEECAEQVAEELQRVSEGKYFN